MSSSTMITFEKVRFHNVFVGTLTMTNKFLEFEEQDCKTFAKWRLDAITQEVVIKAVTSEVEIKIDVNGDAKETVAFQMKGLDDVVQFCKEITTRLNPAAKTSACCNADTTETTVDSVTEQDEEPEDTSTTTFVSVASEKTKEVVQEVVKEAITAVALADESAQPDSKPDNQEKREEETAPVTTEEEELAENVGDKTKEAKLLTAREPVKEEEEMLVKVPAVEDKQEQEQGPAPVLKPASITDMQEEVKQEIQPLLPPIRTPKEEEQEAAKEEQKVSSGKPVVKEETQKRASLADKEKAKRSMETSIVVDADNEKPKVIPTKYSALNSNTKTQSYTKPTGITTHITTVDVDDLIELRKSISQNSAAAAAAAAAAAGEEESLAPLETIKGISSVSFVTASRSNIATCRRSVMVPKPPANDASLELGPTEPEELVVTRHSVAPTNNTHNMSHNDSSDDNSLDEFMGDGGSTHTHSEHEPATYAVPSSPSVRSLRYGDSSIAGQESFSSTLSDSFSTAARLSRERRETLKASSSMSTRSAIVDVDDLAKSSHHNRMSSTSTSTTMGKIRTSQRSSALYHRTSTTESIDEANPVTVLPTPGTFSYQPRDSTDASLKHAIQQDLKASQEQSYYQQQQLQLQLQLEENNDKSHDKDDDKSSTSSKLSGKENGDEDNYHATVSRAISSRLVEATAVDESSDDLELQGPSAVATAVSMEEKEAELRRRRLYMWVTVGCGFIVLIVVVVLILLLVVFPTNESLAPVTLTMEERFEMFHDHVLDIVYDPNTLQDQNSPQSKALHWMVTQDLMYANITEMVATNMHEKLGQRFYLAVFYFTMTEKARWRHCYPSETGEDSACIHPVLESYPNEGVYYDQHMSEPAFRWLSGLDECRWAGVKCSDGSHISNIQLAGYQLQSTLPVELGQLQSLKVLDLQYNLLEGTLPAEWGTLAAETKSVLQSIRLDANALAGSIPEEWCSFNKETLEDLIISNNDLTGTIPSCLSRMTGLQGFSILSNSMTGTIPESFGNLLHLKTLHFAGNHLSGNMPSSVCTLRDDRDLQEASADCLDELSDHYVECACCTKCCDGDGDEGSCTLNDNILGGNKGG